MLEIKILSVFVKFKLLVIPNEKSPMDLNMFVPLPSLHIPSIHGDIKANQGSFQFEYRSLNQIAFLSDYVA